MFGLSAVEVHGPFTGHPPHFFAIDDGIPVFAEFLQLWVRAGGPARDVYEKAGFGELLVLLQVLQGISGEQPPHGLSEVVFECDIDAADGAMEVDAAKQIGSCFDKIDQRGHATGVDCQSAVCKEAVMDESGDVERASVVAGHVRVAEHEVHVVNGIDTAEQRPQAAEPVRVSFLFVGVAGWAANEPGDLSGVQFFERLQSSAGVASDAPDNIAQFVFNNVTADVFVSQSELFEVMIVEEVAEGAVSDIVEQAGDTNEAFDAGAGGHISAGFAEGVIPCVDCDGTEMHDSQNMLESHVLCRWEDPPGRLQLVNLPESLYPGMVDEFLFSGFGCGQSTA